MSEEQYGTLLFIRKHGEAGTPYQFCCGETTIGASKDADIRLLLKNNQLRPIHCIIDVNEEGVATIINKSLILPIIVNGIPVKKGKVLINGDEIEVVGKKFQYINENLTEEDIKKNQRALSQAISTPSKKRQSVVPLVKSSKKTPILRTKIPLKQIPLRKSITTVTSSSSEFNTTRTPKKNFNRIISEECKTTSKIIVSKALGSPTSAKKRRLSLNSHPKNIKNSPRISAKNILLSENIISSTITEDEQLTSLVPSHTMKNVEDGDDVGFLDESNNTIDNATENSPPRRVSIRTPSTTSTKMTPKMNTPINKKVGNLRTSQSLSKSSPRSSKRVLITVTGPTEDAIVTPKRRGTPIKTPDAVITTSKEEIIFIKELSSKGSRLSTNTRYSNSTYLSSKDASVRLSNGQKRKLDNGDDEESFFNNTVNLRLSSSSSLSPIDLNRSASNVSPRKSILRKSLNKTPLAQANLSSNNLSTRKSTQLFNKGNEVEENLIQFSSEDSVDENALSSRKRNRKSNTFRNNNKDVEGGEISNLEVSFSSSVSPKVNVDNVVKSTKNPSPRKSILRKSLNKTLLAQANLSSNNLSTRRSTRSLVKDDEVEEENGTQAFAINEGDEVEEDYMEYLSEESTDEDMCSSERPNRKLSTNLRLSSSSSVSPIINLDDLSPRKSLLRKSLNRSQLAQANLSSNNLSIRKSTRSLVKDDEVEEENEESIDGNASFSEKRNRKSNTPQNNKKGISNSRLSSSLLLSPSNVDNPVKSIDNPSPRKSILKKSFNESQLAEANLSTNDLSLRKSTRSLNKGDNVEKEQRESSSEESVYENDSYLEKSNRKSNTTEIDEGITEMSNLRLSSLSLSPITNQVKSANPSPRKSILKKSLNKSQLAQANSSSNNLNSRKSTQMSNKGDQVEEEKDMQSSSEESTYETTVTADNPSPRKSILKKSLNKSQLAEANLSTTDLSLRKSTRLSIKGDDVEEEHSESSSEVSICENSYLEKSYRKSNTSDNDEGIIEMSKLRLSSSSLSPITNQVKSAQPSPRKSILRKSLNKSQLAQANLSSNNLSSRKSTQLSNKGDKVEEENDMQSSSEESTYENTVKSADNPSPRRSTLRKSLNKSQLARENLSSNILSARKSTQSPNKGDEENDVQSSTEESYSSSPKKLDRKSDTSVVHNQSITGSSRRSLRKTPSVYRYSLDKTVEKSESLNFSAPTQDSPLPKHSLHSKSFDSLPRRSILKSSRSSRLSEDVRLSLKNNQSPNKSQLSFSEEDDVFELSVSSPIKDRSSVKYSLEQEAQKDDFVNKSSRRFISRHSLSDEPTERDQSNSSRKSGRSTMNRPDVISESYIEDSFLSREEIDNDKQASSSEESICLTLSDDENEESRPTKPSSIHEEVEQETPKSAIKGRRSKSLPYNPITEDITPVSPIVKSKTEGGFKTPLNTPGLFENIRRTVLKSRSRSRRSSNNLLDELNKVDVSSKAGKRQRESSSVSERSCKRRRLDAVSDNSFDTDTEDLDSSFDSFKTDEVLSDISDETILRTPEHFSNLTDKPVINEPRTRCLTEPRKIRRESTRRSLNIGLEIQNETSSRTRRTSERASTTSRTSEQSENDFETSKHDLSDVAGLKKLLKTPQDNVTPKNDLENIVSFKSLPKTPRATKSPKNDLTDLKGVKNLMQTPRTVNSPKNDLRNIPNLRKLMSPKSENSPKNDLENIVRFKRLLQTPRATNSPKNDLTNVPNLRKLYSPKHKSTPKNDLENIVRFKNLFEERKQMKSPKNDLTDVRGVKNLLRSPKTIKSPKNDLRNVPNLRKFMSPKSNNSPRNDLENIVSFANVFGADNDTKPAEVDLSDIENNENLFDKLFAKRPLRTYRGRSMSPTSRKEMLYKEQRKTLGDTPQASPRVEKWVQEQAILKSQEEDSEVFEERHKDIKDDKLNESNKVKSTGRSRRNVVQSAESVDDVNAPKRTLRNQKRIEELREEESNKIESPKRTPRGRRKAKEECEEVHTSAVSKRNTRKDAKKVDKQDDDEAAENVPQTVTLPERKTRRAAKKVTSEITEELENKENVTSASTKRETKMKKTVTKSTSEIEGPEDTENNSESGSRVGTRTRKTTKKNLSSQSEGPEDAEKNSESGSRVGTRTRKTTKRTPASEIEGPKDTEDSESGSRVGTRTRKTTKKIVPESGEAENKEEIPKRGRKNTKKTVIEDIDLHEHKEDEEVVFTQRKAASKRSAKKVVQETSQPTNEEPTSSVEVTPIQLKETDVEDSEQIAHIDSTTGDDVVSSPPSKRGRMAVVIKRLEVESSDTDNVAPKSRRLPRQITAEKPESADGTPTKRRRGRKGEVTKTQEVEDEVEITESVEEDPSPTEEPVKAKRGRPRKAAKQVESEQAPEKPTKKRTRKDVVEEEVIIDSPRSTRAKKGDFNRYGSDFVVESPKVETKPRKKVQFEVQTTEESSETRTLRKRNAELQTEESSRRPRRTRK